ncbi:HEAT repeat domain-containing protein [Leucobacter albus]|uniref:HEAT repeat domain-containing protein n=1 Tax=Leucobacter albus TaxID=272210 RepID=A0ABW3TLW6_9MICO
MTGAQATSSATGADDRLAALEAGSAEARTLAEALAIDHTVLLRAAVPSASPALREAAATAQQLGILKRMAAIGDALATHAPSPVLEALGDHRSDTVRGWWCFALAADRSRSNAELLAAALPRIDDELFTVREWVWMALRPRLVDDLPGAIALLEPLTQHASPNVRRFASEALRPRGVWAQHISEFKQRPELGEPLLEPLRADSARYVQDSVANWINDASKTSPDWARSLCARWNAQSPTAETARITKRALRTIGQ